MLAPMFMGGLGPSYETVRAQDGGTTAQAEGDIGKWTVMVYMSGDSSLSTNVLDDLEEMKDVGSGNGLEIIVLSDRSGEGDSHIFHILEGEEVEIPTSDIDPTWGDELNLGDPDTLSSFVKYAAIEYPAEHYLLDLWGHGNGWVGVCPDKGDKLTSVELQRALDSVVASGISIDMMSLDACQMGMFELFYQLRGRVDYAIGSEKDVPLAGWPYDTLLQIIKTQPDITPIEYGQQFIDFYITWSTANSGYSATLSLIQLDKLEEVGEALDSYAGDLITDIGYFHPEIGLARGDTEEYDGADQYDLIHLVSNIGKTTRSRALQLKGDELAEAIDGAVIYEKHWTRLDDEPADNATGMSIWFPRTTVSADYRELDISIDTRWDDFLDAAYPKWNLDGREEISVDVIGWSWDKDGDGLKDTIDLQFDTGDYDNYSFDFFDAEWELMNIPDLPIYGRLINGTIYSILWKPTEPGIYHAAIYFRDGNGTLLNYSLIEEGLYSEKEYIVSGHVLSNAGKRMRNVVVLAIDPQNNTIARTQTNENGRYEISLIAPWDTDGENITIFCDLGIYSQNATIQQLEEINTLNIEVENGPGFTLALLYLALVLNMVGFGLVGSFIMNQKEREKGIPATMISDTPVTTIPTNLTDTRVEPIPPDTDPDIDNKI